METKNGDFSDVYSEGQPAYLCDSNIEPFMGARIGNEKKQLMLPFLKKNLGVISQREISRRLEIGKTTVNKWSGELGFRHPKHSVNESFFNDWNEESAYVLGYIFADGNISWNTAKSYNSLTVTASEKDREHLERIRNIISSTKPLLYSKKTRSYRLIVNSKVLCERLMKTGLVPAKSLVIKFPKVPKKYIRHFIRGVIDGDGTVRYVDREKSPYFEIRVSSGSVEFLNDLSENVKKHVNVDARVRKAGRNTFLLQYSCKRGSKLADWIYHDSDLFLVRKFEQYKKGILCRRRCMSL